MSVDIQKVFSEMGLRENLDELCLLLPVQDIYRREFNPRGIGWNHPRLTEFIEKRAPENSSRYFIERINGKIQLIGDSSDDEHFRVYYYGKK